MGDGRGRGEMGGGGGAGGDGGWGRCEGRGAGNGDSPRGTRRAQRRRMGSDSWGLFRGSSFFGSWIWGTTPPSACGMARTGAIPRPMSWGESNTRGGPG